MYSLQRILKISLVLCALILCSFSFLTLEASQDDGHRALKVITDLSHQSGKLGSYRALIIGINDYQDSRIPDLETAVSDAKALADLLGEKYGFKIKLLLDRKAGKEAIFKALRDLAKSTMPNDSVLIYYAGHGELDRLYNDGWWIPADAEAGKLLTYLDNVEVQKSMRSMKARHVLLIADSCYSGTLFGRARAMPSVITNKYYLDLYNEKSRWGMTSGNKEPVSDRGTGGHSVFAYQLLKALKQTERQYTSTQEIYTRIAPIVSNNSEQTPLCRPIRNTGDQGGEFVFVASGAAIVSEPSTQPDRTTLEVNANVSGATVLVDGREVGKTPLSGVHVSPGEHSIRVEKEGYEPYRKRIRLEAGRSMSMDVHLSRVIEQLKQSGEVTRGWLGVAVQDLSEELAKYYGIKNNNGILVAEVFPGDPADEAGIKPKDIILEVNNKRVKTDRDLTTMIANTGVGELVKILLLRNGAERTVRVRIAKRDASKVYADKSKKGPEDELGIRVSKITPEIARRFNITSKTKGVIIVVIEPNSKAFEAGLTAGDIIKEINRTGINTADEYHNRIKQIKKGKSIGMLIKRINAGFFVIKMTK